MAEPILSDFDPLSEYLQETGEDVPSYGGTVKPMPGNLEGPEMKESGRRHPFFELCGRFVGFILDMISTYSPPAAHHMTEQFKFLVISSSLLSSELSTNTASRPPAFDSPRSAFAHEDPPGNYGKDPSKPTEESEGVWLWACVGVPLAVFSGSLTLMFFCLVAALGWSISQAEEEGPSLESRKLADVFPIVVESLEGLAHVTGSWDTCISEAMALCEEEENSMMYDSSQPLMSPTTPLRTALRDALHDTSSRSDTVRSLLSPLTSSTSLRLLAEMYSPARISPASPEPMSPSAHLSRKSVLRHSVSLRQSPRPLSSSASMPLAPRSTRKAANRQTPISLSGPPYEDIYVARSIPLDLSSAQEQIPSASASQINTQSSVPSTPPQPNVLSRARSDTQLRHSLQDTSKYFMSFPLSPSPTFTSTSYHDVSGSDTSDLQSAFSPTPTPSRRRTLSSASAPSSPTHYHRARKATIVQKRRNPLAIPSLHSHLHAALESRRWAAAHLLALRFEDDDGENQANRNAYWEDVRSVIQLWASALDEVVRSLQITAAAVRMRVEEMSRLPITPMTHAFPAGGPTSFAPAPNTMARFLGRIDVMSSALEGAQTQLGASTAALRSWGLASREEAAIDDSPLQAYDTIRHLLATALKEYERGRADLVTILKPPEPDSGSVEDDDTPNLVQDSGSEKQVSPEPGSPPTSAMTLRILESVIPTAVDADGKEEDAVTTQLLLPGIEQVFEAESGTLSTGREKSKLTREERIRQSQARRQSGVRGSRTAQSADAVGMQERWGPGGEVVQELKDVIQKVGQRRLALVERKQAGMSLTPPMSPLGLQDRQ